MQGDSGKTASAPAFVLCPPGCADAVRRALPPGCDLIVAGSPEEARAAFAARTAAAAFVDAGDLTKLEEGILRVLSGAPGRTFSRVELLRELHGEAAGSVLPRAIDSTVSRLRRKLGDAGWRVQTVWGRGYRWNAGERPARPFFTALRWSAGTLGVLVLAMLLVARPRPEDTTWTGGGASPRAVAAVTPLPPVQLSSEPSPESSTTPAAELERRLAPVSAAAPASVGDASAAVGTYTGFCRSFRENQGVLEDSSWEFGDDGDSSGEFGDDDFEFSPAFVYDRKGDLDGYDLGCADDEGLVLAGVAMPPPSETVAEGETFRPAAIQAAAEPETSSVSVRGGLAKRRAAPAAAPVPPIDPLPPKEGFDIHVMTEEDRTLSNLARTLGLPLADLLAANPQITDPDRVRVGQPLYVPVRPEADSRAVP